MAHDESSNDFASKGVAGAGLGLGIAGTALALLAGSNGGLGGLFGNNVNVATQAAIDLEGERRLARVEAHLEAQAVKEAKDAEIESLKTQLAQSQTLRYIDDKTADMITGKVYMSPTSMADPYIGTPQVLESYDPIEAAAYGFGRANRLRGRFPVSRNYFDYDNFY